MARIGRYPRFFYDDHCERDLPAPEPIRENATHVWLNADDPSFKDVLADATHYDHPDGPDSCKAIVRAAKAFIIAASRNGVTQ